MPHKHAWWNDPGVGWTGSSQDRFTLDKNKFFIKEEYSERQMTRDGNQRCLVKEEDPGRQRNRDGSQRHAVLEEDLMMERNREQDKMHPVREEDSQRVTTRDRERNKDKHGDAERDKTQESPRCHFCEQELTALTPKASQLSRYLTILAT